MALSKPSLAKPSLAKIQAFAEGATGSKPGAGTVTPMAARKTAPTGQKSGLVPAGASMADLWATGDVLAMVTEAKAVKRIKARLVWTRHRGFTNQAKALTEQAKAELGIKPLDTAMGLRVAYVDALGAGLTAAETPDAQARAEVQALIAEVCAILA